MSEEPNLNAEAQGTQARMPPRVLKLIDEWKVLAWPSIGAVAVALIHFLGFAARSGVTVALGIEHLTEPSISQNYVILGGIAVAALGLQVIVLVIGGFALRAIARWVYRRLPGKIQGWLGTFTKHAAWGWTVVALAFAALGTGLIFTRNLTREVRGMILKPAVEVGTAWMRMSLDPEQDWALAYQFFLAGITTVFASLSWWIFTRFVRNRIGRAVFGTWAALQVLNLVTGFAFIYGAGSTIQPFPVVGFSNQEKLLGENVVPVLIGSDENVYAFFVLFKGDTRGATPSPAKGIVCVPRTEVKWLTVVRHLPLYNVAHYHDLKRLGRSDTLNDGGAGLGGSPIPTAVPTKSAPPN